MKGFVLDTSVTLAWCFADEATAKSTALLEQLEIETGWVPAIWSLEVGNILLAAERHRRISYADAFQFLELLQKLNIQTDEETAQRAFHEVFTLAGTEKLTTYDAAYLELAMRRGLPLATKDKTLQKAARHVGVEVISY